MATATKTAPAASKTTAKPAAKPAAKPSAQTPAAQKQNALAAAVAAKKADEAKKAAAAKAEADKAKAIAAEAAAKAKAEKKAADDAEAQRQDVEFSETFNAQVGAIAPEGNTEAGIATANSLMEQAASLKEETDSKAVEFGIVWLALRRGLPGTATAEDVIKAGGIAKAAQSDKWGPENPLNGFHLAGFKNESEAAMAIGWAKMGPKGPQMSEVSRAVLLAKVHLSLIEAGREEGVTGLSKTLQSSLSRSNLDMVRKVVPLIVGGSEDTEVLAIVNDGKAARTTQTLTADVSKLTGNQLAAKALKQLRKIRDNMKRLEPINKAGGTWAQEALTKKDLTAANADSLKTILQECAEAFLRMAADIGMELEEAVPEVPPVATGTVKPAVKK